MGVAARCVRLRHAALSLLPVLELPVRRAQSPTRSSCTASLSFRVNNGNLHRHAAFSDDPAGGNPAGVWIGDALPDSATMQAIASEVGYSETAFAGDGLDRKSTRLNSSH